MDKSCLKCGHVAVFEQSAPLQCTNCGAIYAKVEQAARQALAQQSRANPHAFADTAPPGGIEPAPAPAVATDVVVLPKRKLLAAVVALAVAIGSYWYASPYLVMYQMRKAVEQRDAEGINSRIDYPALRDNLKGQFASKMAGEIQKSSDNPFAALGTMMGMALANQMIDMMLRPEVLMNAMRTGDLDVKSAARGEQGGKERQGLKWKYERSSADRIVAYPLDPQDPASQGAGFVFVRRGFADWKLTEIVLPK